MIDTVKTAVLPRPTLAECATMPVNELEAFFEASVRPELNRVLMLPRGHMKTSALVDAATRRNAVFGYGRPCGPIPEATGRHFTLQLQDDLVGDATSYYALKPGSTPAKDAFDRAWLARTRGSRPVGSPLWDPDDGSTVMR